MTSTGGTPEAPRGGAGRAAAGMSLSIVAAVSMGHLLNDIMQSLLQSIYPLLKDSYGLTFVQVGLLTFAFQITASFLQPVVGAVTDRWPMPYSLPTGMLSACAGLLTLAFAHGFPTLVTGACLIGVGSSILHPEASRVARMASGGRHGLAQAMFQVGGNTGQAIGPLLAALIVIPLGQQSLKWFALLALVGFALLSWVGTWYSAHARANRSVAATLQRPLLPRRWACSLAAR